MRRVLSKPRDGFRETVVSQGLVYPDTDMPDGSVKPYWFEGAYYEFTEKEVAYLESVTEELHIMCVNAAREIVKGSYGNLGLSPEALKLAARSLEERPFTLYGRFDLSWDGTGDAKMLEYNADTPTGMVESSIAQWYWLEDTHPEKDQFNSLHERLVETWSRFKRINPGIPTVHFAHLPEDADDKGEITGEEWMTIAYLRDTATEAGLTTKGIELPDIGFDSSMSRFVDSENEWMGAVFKLYPWENMLEDEFGKNIEASWGYTKWIEPLWKVVLSNKALLAALWDLYPNHPNLLPAYLDEPKDLISYIAKPLHGREGDGIYAVVEGEQILDQRKEDSYGDEGYCFQQWNELPKFDGNYTVLGSWIIDGKAAGVGIRESDGPITDYFARFVPHMIDTPAPSEEQRSAWVAEDKY